MIETLLYFVIYLLIIGIILWLFQYLIDTLPMFEPIRAVAKTVLMVIGCIILIILLLQILNGGLPRLRL